MVSGADEDRLRELIEAGRALVSERELGQVLDRLLGVAREVTGARYAAIGVLDERREALADLITAGIYPEARRTIGDLPHGRGVLGLLISDPRPLRLADVGSHPQSYGFPAGHPPMRSFLGVPILIHGEAWGNLYLTDKRGGEEFDEADEESAVVLAAWAGIAVENARLLQHVEERRVELERAVRAFEATSEIAQAVGGLTQLDNVLELIAKRSCAIVGASAVAIVLVDGDQFVVAAAAGMIPLGIVGARFPSAGSMAARVLGSVRPERIGRLPNQLHFALREHGVQPTSGLFVPMQFHGTNVGVIEAFDRIDGPEFRPEDERVLLAAAASAATAVATAQSVERDRLRRTLQAAEQERRRSARELHDQTLQGLAALRLQLATARRQGDLASWQQAGEEVIEQIDEEIANLRAIITDLRPPALDESGLEPALQALIERVRARHNVEIDATVHLATEGADSAATPRPDPELEAVAYRVAQESLNNAATHGNPQRIEIEVLQRDDSLYISVSDDGQGFDPNSISSGFGLAGMRERISLAGGQLQITSGTDGTTVQATLPLTYSARNTA
jgi:two-component system, NarL family, sensor histidine kinase DevS